jgi:hypothetical protein
MKLHVALIAAGSLAVAATLPRPSPLAAQGVPTKNYIRSNEWCRPPK